MSPNRIFMFLINPPSGNVRIQKLIAKHIFECFEKWKEEDGKTKYCRTNDLLFGIFCYLEISCGRCTIHCIRLQINMSVCHVFLPSAIFLPKMRGPRAPGPLP